MLLADGLIRIFGKGSKERIVPMHVRVAAELRRVTIPASGPIFTNSKGGPFPPARVSRMMSLYLGSVGIAATAHQLRHWFGSRTYRECSDIRVVQELLGHASPTTTAMYAAWSQKKAAAAVAAL